MNKIYRLAASAALLGRVAPLLCLTLVPACNSRKADDRQSASMLIVYNAGSLARPIRVAFDSFASGRKLTLQQESAGSLESARKITELGKVPDVIALADAEIFPRLLMPEHLTWYLPFARNRMVLAYRPSSRFAKEVNGTNWWKVLDRQDVSVGRSDPNQDPNGYRTLLVLRLTERLHAEPGLAKRLLDRWGSRYVRPKESDLIALLQAGEVDYVWSYESIARAAGLQFLTLGDSLDLGNPEDSSFYAMESVRVLGSARVDSLTIAGGPIMYALSIPESAPHSEVAREFVSYLVSKTGRRVLRSAQLDAFDAMQAVGANGSRVALPFVNADKP